MSVRRDNISPADGDARGAAAPATAVPGSAIPSAGRSDAAAGGAAAAGQPEPGLPGTPLTRAEGPGTAGTSRGSDPAGRRDPAAVRAFIERFATHLAQAGFPRTPARIFVALLTSDSSKLTAAELGEILQASPASISGGVRYLLQVGLAAAHGEPGSRRLHYWVSEQVWRDIVRLRDRQFTSWAAELRAGVGVLGPQSPAGVRMEETASYFDFISAEMSGLMARWEARAERSPAPGTGDTARSAGSRQ